MGSESSLWLGLDLEAVWLADEERGRVATGLAVVMKKNERGNSAD